MRSRFINLTAVALLLFFPNAVWPDDRVFSRTSDVGPLQISYRDLYSIVEEIRETGSFSPDARIIERLSIAGKDSGLDLINGFTREQLLDAPQTAYSINYRFEQYAGNDTRMFSVWMWFDDDRRLIEVTGTRKSQVDAVFALITDDLQESFILLGGDNMRLLLAPVAMVLFAGLMSILPFIFIQSQNVATVLSLLSATLSAVFFFLSFPKWEYWFPGTLIYDVVPSLMDRYEVLFWVLGLALPFALERAWKATKRHRVKSA